MDELQARLQRRLQLNNELEPEVESRAGGKPAVNQKPQVAHTGRHIVSTKPIIPEKPPKPATKRKLIASPAHLQCEPPRRPSPVPKPKGSSSSLTSLDEKSDDANNNNVVQEMKAARAKLLVTTRKARSPPVGRRRISYENVDPAKQGSETLQLGNRGSNDSGKGSDSITGSEEHLAEERFDCGEGDEGCRDTGSRVQSPVLKSIPPVPILPMKGPQTSSEEDSDYEPVDTKANKTPVHLFASTVLQGMQKNLSQSGLQGKPQQSTTSSSTAPPPLPARPSHGGQSASSINTPPPPLPPRQGRRMPAERPPKGHQREPAPPLPPRNTPVGARKASAISPLLVPAREVKRAPEPHHLAGMDKIIKPPTKKGTTDISWRPGPNDYLPMDKSSSGPDYIDEPTSVPVRPSKVTDPRPHSTDSEDYLLLLNEDGSDSGGSNMFDDEPLYQIYHETAVMRGVIEGSAEDEDECEAIYDDPDSMRDRYNHIVGDGGSATSVLSNATSAKQPCSSVRKLWCETAQVKNCGVLLSLTPGEKKLQESLYEILTSEASYLKSLKVLIKEFIQAPKLSGTSGVLDKTDLKVLFSNVKAVRDVSVKFLNEMEALWKADCLLMPAAISAILQEYAMKEFDVYVKYCSNQRYQMQAMDRLKEKNEEFNEVIKEIEGRPECKGLTIQSFLILPMQRALRFPILMDAVCNRMPDYDPNAEVTKRCLNALQKLAKRCNDGARRMENIEKLTNIRRKLIFDKNTKSIPIVSESRYLVKEGAMLKLKLKETTSIFEKVKDRLKRDYLHLFLFNDLLIITRKKSDEFVVEEYADSAYVRAEILSDEEVARRLPGAPKGSNNVFVLSLVKKHVDFMLSCKTESDRTRWVEAFAEKEEDKERIYDVFDCPQVQAIYQYVAIEPDELSLEVSDIINVSRKMRDGWYEGMRLRDGVKGWFPQNHTIEIESKDTRAKNVRQKFRLLESAHS